ncbi:hypothetical protein [Streptomyces sp. NPDC058726]|uniref:hypothetical protein n=1 Tax=Streptomyces sp. NPDC058726 TaxID=3346611 RepID=UPI0036CBE0FC
MPGVGRGGRAEGRNGAAEGGQGGQEVLRGGVGAHDSLVTGPAEQDVRGPAVVGVHGPEDLDVRQTGGREVAGAPVGRQGDGHGAEMPVSPAQASGAVRACSPAVMVPASAGRGRRTA